MVTKARLSFFIAFIVSLAVWVGGGVFDSISSHPVWYANPVSYIRTYAAPEGVPGGGE